MTGVQVLVVAGCHEVPATEIERRARCYVQPGDPPLQLTGRYERAVRAYHMRDGSVRFGACVVHRSALVETLRLATTEAELEQACERARTVRASPDQPVHVILLTCVPTTFMVDELVAMEDLTVNTLDMVSLRLGGIALRSASEVVRMAGELGVWLDMTHKVIKHALARSRFTPPNLNKKESLLRFGGVKRWTEATYRVAGARGGPPKQCLVPGALATCEEAAARLARLGPILVLGVAPWQPEPDPPGITAEPELPPLVEVDDIGDTLDLPPEIVPLPGSLPPELLPVPCLACGGAVPPGSPSLGGQPIHATCQDELKRKPPDRYGHVRAGSRIARPRLWAPAHVPGAGQPGAQA